MAIKGKGVLIGRIANIISKIKCKVGKHAWISHNEPVVGRRNLSRRAPDGIGMIVELGPEETFYPSASGPIHPWKECTCCGKRLMLTNYGWI